MLDQWGNSNSFFKCQSKNLWSFSQKEILRQSVLHLGTTQGLSSPLSLNQVPLGSVARFELIWSIKSPFFISQLGYHLLLPLAAPDPVKDLWVMPCPSTHLHMQCHMTKPFPSAGVCGIRSNNCYFTACNYLFFKKPFLLSSNHFISNFHNFHKTHRKKKKKKGKKVK